MGVACSRRGAPRGASASPSSTIPTTAPVGASAGALPVHQTERAALHSHHRLRASRDFERVRAQGRTWGHPLLVLTVAPAPDDSATRCGFIASRRVGPAVTRNRVKRRLREITRRALPGVLTGIDLVFSARPATATADFTALQSAVHELLRRARVVRAPDPPGGSGGSGAVE